MKKILFGFLLFSSIFGNIISNADFKKRFIKDIFNKNNKIQKLISKAKSIEAQKDKEINSPKRSLAEKTILSKNIDNKSAKVQIIKFYNFTNDIQNKNIEFNTYFYFFSDQKIPEQIKFNIIISSEKDKPSSQETIEATCDLIIKETWTRKNHFL